MSHVNLCRNKPDDATHTHTHTHTPGFTGLSRWLPQRKRKKRKRWLCVGEFLEHKNILRGEVDHWALDFVQSLIPVTSCKEENRETEGVSLRLGLDSAPVAESLTGPCIWIPLVHLGDSHLDHFWLKQEQEADDRMPRMDGLNEETYVMLYVCMCVSRQSQQPLFSMP